MAGHYNSHIHNNIHNINNVNELILLIIITVSIVCFAVIMMICYHSPLEIQFNTEYNVRDVIHSDTELEEDEKCSICMMDLNTGKLIKINCEHIFHDNCVKKWTHTNIFLRRDSKCPLCNYVYYEF